MADCKNATQISARLSVKLDPTRESVSMTNDVTLKHKEVQLLLTNPRDASAKQQFPIREEHIVNDVI